MEQWALDRSPTITKTTMKIKKYFLPFDELAAPFFGEKESIISVKNRIQFVFNLFVDTIKKQKKAVCQFVCVLELKLVFLNKIITIQF